ncbi:hypothetical protein HN695_04275 [Candidatus Woesearchaeota archaeon]|jgi:hypothetical protein|nr:hypothetical protein [Candidatus Woesearchaeota archaeon]MBT6336638.1 hypothetical protein [Candidatus Woesearchaeota archaeon]MBT7927528.1 hypothetical protein [Candidatus Woesearchaeota archaeon]
MGEVLTLEEKLDRRVESDLEILSDVYDYLKEPISNFFSMLGRVRTSQPFPLYPLEKMVDLFQSYLLDSGDKGFVVYSSMPKPKSQKQFKPKSYQKLSKKNFEDCFGIGLKVIGKSNKIHLAGEQFYVGTGRVNDPVFIFFNQGNLHMFDSKSRPIEYKKLEHGKSGVSYKRPRTVGNNRLIITKLYFNRFDQEKNSAEAVEFMQDMWYTNPKRFNDFGLKLLLKGFINGMTDISGNFHLTHIKYEKDENDDSGIEKRKDIKVFYVNPLYSDMNVRFSWRGPYVLIRNGGHSLAGAANLNPYPGILTSRPEYIEHLQEVIAVRNLNSLLQDPEMRVNGTEYIFSADEIKDITKNYSDSSTFALFMHFSLGKTDSVKLLINTGEELKTENIQYRKRNEPFPDPSSLRKIKTKEFKKEVSRIRKAHDKFDSSNNSKEAVEYLRKLWISNSELFDNASGRIILLEASLESKVHKDGGIIPFSYYEDGEMRRFYAGKKYNGKEITLSWRGPYVILSHRNDRFIHAYERSDFGFEVSGSKKLKELIEAVQIRNTDSLIQPCLTINNVRYRFSTPELSEYLGGLSNTTDMAFMGHVFKDPSQSEFHFLVKANDTTHMFRIQNVRYGLKRK